MFNESVYPTYETYCVLSRMLEAKGEYRASLELLEHVQSRGGLMPDGAAYEVVLGVCAQMGERRVSKIA